MVQIVGRIGFGVVFLLALVGFNSAVLRGFHTLQYLADPSSVDITAGEPPGAAGFDARYYAHPYLTLVHVATGLLFMVLGPLQFVAAIRNRWLGVHRWCGRVFLVAALLGAVTALAFVPLLPVFGSFSTKVGVVLAGTFFLIALVQGYRHVRRREIAQHREWMIRMFALGLGISTFRVLLPVLMMPPFNVTFVEAWNTVVWLGFVLNLTAAEVWINLTRPPVVRRQVPAPSSVGIPEFGTPTRAPLPVAE